MHCAGTAVHRYETGGENDCFPIEKRVSRLNLVDLSAGKRCERLAHRIEFRIGAKLIDQLVGEEKRFGSPIARELPNNVNLVWIDGDRQICRQSPWRRRPNVDAGFEFPPAAGNREVKG